MRFPIAFVALGAACVVGCGAEDTAERIVFVSPPYSQVQATSALPPIQVAFVASDGDVVRMQSEPVWLELIAADTSVRLLGGVYERVVDGVATFDSVEIHRAGTYRIRALSNLGSSLTSVVSEPFDIIAGPASRLLIDSTHWAAVGSPLYVRVTFADAYVNPTIAPSQPVHLELPAGSAWTGTLVQATTNGVAVFDNLSTTKSGNHTIVAMASGFSPDTGVVFVLPGPAAQLAWTIQPVDVRVGVAMPLFHTEIRDVYGNAVWAPLMSGWGSCTAVLHDNPTGAAFVALGSTTPGFPNFGAGVSNFPNVAIDKAGQGFTIVMSCRRHGDSSHQVTSAPSAPFNVFP
jgi:hypothetical protein